MCDHIAEGSGEPGTDRIWPIGLPSIQDPRTFPHIATVWRERTGREVEVGECRYCHGIVVRTVAWPHDNWHFEQSTDDPPTRALLRVIAYLEARWPD